MVCGLYYKLVTGKAVFNQVHRFLNKYYVFENRFGSSISIHFNL